MDCYICKTESKILQRPDSKEVECSECGQYRISGTAIKRVEDGVIVFRADDARQWLSERQVNGAIPLIDSTTAGMLSDEV